MRILLTGGGTGGHITPLIAVAEELQSIGAVKSIEIELRYFGAPGNYENLLDAAGINVSKILGGKLRSYFDPKNIIDIPKFFVSIVQLLYKVFLFMPDVLFSKGGPGALATALVCRFYRIPVIIHDSDSVPGLTNQISGRCAERILISFSSAAEFFRGDVELVGNPVRRALADGPIDQSAAKTTLGFDATKPLLLFISGSQGATRVNDFILNNLRALLLEFQILHQTGADNFEAVQQEINLLTARWPSEEKSKYKIIPYFEDDEKENLRTALSAADIVVSRAGSGSIFEIAAFGKPSILIPLPEAANDHQVKNAYEYAKSGAAVVLETDNLSLNVFLSEVKKMLYNPEKLKLMSEAAKKFSRPEAAKTIAEEIIKIGTK